MSNELKQNFQIRINSLITQINSLNDDGNNDEIKSNLSRYLCILISGYIEKNFIHMLVKYFSVRNSPKIVRFITQTHKHTTNLKMKKIEDILSSFDTNWTTKLKDCQKYDEYAGAINSILDNRHKIAHGENTTVTVKSLRDWFEKINDFFEEINKIIHN